MASRRIRSADIHWIGVQTLWILHGDRRSTDSTAHSHPDTYRYRHTHPDSNAYTPAHFYFDSYTHIKTNSNFHTGSIPDLDAHTLPFTNSSSQPNTLAHRNSFHAVTNDHSVANPNSLYSSAYDNSPADYYSRTHTYPTLTNPKLHFAPQKTNSH